MFKDSDFFQIGGLDFIEELDNKAAVEYSGGNTLRWVNASNGQVPSGAVSGGSEPGRPNLFICRASGPNGGTHPGKIVGRNCNFGFGGQEILRSSYQVLTHSNFR